MKTKEVIELAAAVVIFVIVGYVIFLLVGPKSDSSKGVTVEKIVPIENSYNSEALNNIGDPSKAKNFYTKPDLTTGIGNKQPFGSLK